MTYTSYSEALHTPRVDVVERYKAISRLNISSMREWHLLSPEVQEAIDVVSHVLPFRTNPYVIRELIDWERVPDDPVFQLTFPQRGMLSEDDYNTIAELVRKRAAIDVIRETANRIRYRLNPHPSGQMTHNIPSDLHGRPLLGLQHKYRETVLFFPSHSQSCHAYCTYCFRWAQFVDIPELKFSNPSVERLIDYLKQQPAVTDLLFTGGDPMIMSTKVLRQYIKPLLDPSLEHVQTIRIGTKAPAYWPQRFVTDPDADDLMRLFEQVVASGRHLALMVHYTTSMELSTPIAQEAVRRIRSTGAEVRIQSPLVRHVNDTPEAWKNLWQQGLRLGAIPYYMFVERDTGAKLYFELPLFRAWQIFCDAFQHLSGLGRTVRGPVMSTLSGKVHILGVSEVDHQPAFVLEYLQARQPDLVRRPFFARFNPNAVWFNQLEPLSEHDYPFFPSESTDAPS
jgi:KamA family protein